MNAEYAGLVNNCEELLALSGLNLDDSIALRFHNASLRVDLPAFLKGGPQRGGEAERRRESQVRRHGRRVREVDCGECCGAVLHAVV